MFHKACQSINNANTGANAVSPKTDTQASSHSNSEEIQQGIRLGSSSAGLPNRVVQLPPYVYVPSKTSLQESPPKSQDATRIQEDSATSRGVDVEVVSPQEPFLRRSLPGFPQLFPTSHMYHYPLTNEERTLQSLQPQYIVVSPTFASRSAFLRPYDLSMQGAHFAWLQQQQHLHSARLHAPELNSTRATPMKVETHVKEKHDAKTVSANIVEEVPLKQDADISVKKEPEQDSPRVVLGDKPKRPLSAYNYFFKEEREKMIWIETGQGNNKRHGIKFEDMAKTIAKKWNLITPEALEKFEALAEMDKERYKVAMQEYNQRKNVALAAVHKELVSTVSNEKMERYLKNQDQKGTGSVKKAIA